LDGKNEVFSKNMKIFFFWTGILCPLILILWVICAATISNIFSGPTNFLILGNTWIRPIMGLGILLSMLYQLLFIFSGENKKITQKRLKWVLLLLAGNIFVVPFFAYIFFRNRTIQGIN